MRTRRIFATAVLAAVAAFIFNAVLPTNFHFQTLILYTVVFTVVFTIPGIKKMGWRLIPYSALTALLAVTIVLLASLTVGWLVYQSSPCEIRISNTDFYEHNVTIEVYSSDRLLLEKSYLMKPESYVKCEIPGFTFPQRLRVTLDNELEEAYDLSVHGYIFITIINESGKLKISVHQMAAD